MNIEQIKTQLHKIQEMHSTQLAQYLKDIFLSQADEKAKGYLIRAVEIRRGELSLDGGLFGAMAVSSNTSGIE